MSQEWMLMKSDISFIKEKLSSSSPSSLPSSAPIQSHNKVDEVTRLQSELMAIKSARIDLLRDSSSLQKQLI